MHARAVRLSFAGVRVADRSHFHALTSELEQHDLSVQPPAEQYERKRWLLDTLRPVLAKHTGGDLHVFGSCANGFWVKGSDIDTCLMIKRYSEGASMLAHHSFCIRHNLTPPVQTKTRTKTRDQKRGRHQDDDERHDDDAQLILHEAHPFKKAATRDSHDTLMLSVTHLLPSTDARPLYFKRQEI